MLSSLLLFLHPVFEFMQDVDPAATGETEGAPTSGGGNFLVPMAIIMAIFYFLLIAPERKKQKQREALLGTLSKGERVMTTSGMYGTVVQVKDDVITLQVADNVRLRFSKAAVQQVLDRDEKKDAPTKELPQAEDLQETS